MRTPFPTFRHLSGKAEVSFLVRRAVAQLCKRRFSSPSARLPSSQPSDALGKGNGGHKSSVRREVFIREAADNQKLQPLWQAPLHPIRYATDGSRINELCYFRQFIPLLSIRLPDFFNIRMSRNVARGASGVVCDGQNGLVGAHRYVGYRTLSLIRGLHSVTFFELELLRVGLDLRL